MHHAPAGPPLSARLAALLRGLCRTRLLPVVLTGLVLGVLAVVLPTAPSDADPTGTATLTSPSQGRQVLVPATGDGWTQDGVPAEAPPSSPSAAAEEDAPAVVEPPPVPLSPSPSPSSPTQQASVPAAESSEESEPPTASASVPAPSTSAAPEPPVVTTSQADLVLAAVDAARATAGCDALAVDEALAASLEVPAGVAVVAGEGTDPATVVAQWLADPEDSAVLLDCGLTRAGLAVADGRWTLLLA